MRADIELLKFNLWEETLDMHVTRDEQERFIALLYHLTDSTGQPDWDDVENMLGEDYLVLTDVEADDAVRDYIDEEAGTFSPSFLSGFTGIDEDVFETLQGVGKYDAIRSMIQDFDEFVEAAVKADGRGHFLSFYDGNEHEVTVNDTTYYIYRVN